MMIIEYLKTLSPELVTYLLAMIPVGELRTSIPFAMTVLKLPTWSAFLFSFAGTTTISIIVFYFLDPTTKFLRKHSKLMNRFFTWLFHKTRARHSKKMEELGLIALLLFVAVPLPGSGAWTGTLIAYLFNLKSQQALPVIAMGILASAVLVTFGTDLLIFLFR